MLIDAGKLPNRLEHTEVEIDRAVTQYLFEQAGDRKFLRVAEVMRDRWHGGSIKERH